MRVQLDFNDISLVRDHNQLCLVRTHDIHYGNIHIVQRSQPQKQENRGTKEEVNIYHWETLAHID